MTLKLLQCAIITLQLTFKLPKIWKHISEITLLSLFAKFLVVGVPKYLWNCAIRAEALSMTTLMKSQFSIPNPQIPWFHFCSWLLIKNSSSFYIHYILYNSAKIVLQGSIYEEWVSENDYVILLFIQIPFFFSFLTLLA